MKILLKYGGDPNLEYSDSGNSEYGSVVSSNQTAVHVFLEHCEPDPHYAGSQDSDEEIEEQYQMEREQEEAEKEEERERQRQEAEQEANK